MNRTFDSVCPRCKKVFPKVKLGVHSYGEFICPHCSTEYYIKTTEDGVRSNYLVNKRNY